MHTPNLTADTVSQDNQEINQQQLKLDKFNQAFNANWSDYYQLLNELPPEYELSACLKLLNTADGLLNQEQDFSTSAVVERYLVGGISDTQTRKRYPFETNLLGDMQSHASFKKILKNDPTGLAKLLKIIPKTGPIDGWHFSQFVDSYRALFLENGVKQAPLFAATRLLSMKRPDQFVVISQETNALFCQAFSIKTLKNQDFQRYWDQVILPIQQTAWYKTDLPMDVSQLAFFRARVILIERLICTPATNFVETGTNENQNSNQIAQPNSEQASSAEPQSSSSSSSTEERVVSSVTTMETSKAVKKPVSQPKKMTIAKLKSAKGNKNAATKLMSQYYFANKAEFAKVDMAASREIIIQKLIDGGSVEEAFAEAKATHSKK